MNATELLKQQHAELRALLQQAAAADDPAGRRPMLKAEILYPAVRRLRTESAEELFLTSLEQHHVVHVLTAALLLASHQGVPEALVERQETVREHIEQEEQTVEAPLDVLESLRRFVGVVDPRKQPPRRVGVAHHDHLLHP